MHTAAQYSSTLVFDVQFVDANISTQSSDKFCFEDTARDTWLATHMTKLAYVPSKCRFLTIIFDIIGKHVNV